MRDDTRVGSPDTKLIIIRGNSGSGKSSIARALRTRGGRGIALVEQDYLRRIVLQERERPDGISPALIEQTARFCLDNDYHVALEGILAASRHSIMLNRLLRDHRGRSYIYYLDVSLEETLRRHTTRPQATEFSGEDMRGWYLPHDLLGVDGEQIIPEHHTLQQSIEVIMGDTGLLPAAMPASLKEPEGRTGYHTPAAHSTDAQSPRHN